MIIFGGKKFFLGDCKMLICFTISTLASLKTSEIFIFPSQRTKETGDWKSFDF